MENITWKIIEQYFIDNPNFLVKHHLDSYNDFVSIGLQSIFKDNNPWKFSTRNGEGLINLYIGGREGQMLYFSKPIIYDKDTTSYMYPNSARLRNMSYMTNLFVDIVVEITENGSTREHILEKIKFGAIPIMLQSKLCILNNLPPKIRYTMGECVSDYGGYFIISGKEKVILPQEDFADNTCNIKIHKSSDLDYSHSVSIRTVSDDPSKHIRTTSIYYCRGTTIFESEGEENKEKAYIGGNILVNIPNVKRPIPLFIVMRALGITSDYDIIKTCIMDMEKNKRFIDMFVVSIHDANIVLDRMAALEFIANATKRGTIDGLLDIFANYMLVHLGETNYIDKAFFLGKMVFKMLKVVTGEDSPTDRDSFLNKRVLPTGRLMYNLFREYYIIQKREVERVIDSEYNFHTGQYENNLYRLIEQNINTFLEKQQVSVGLMNAFKGNWGATEHTYVEGVVQDLNRLSYFTFISHLRKLILQMEPTSKVLGPRYLNSSTWGYTDPVDTPDGEHIGLHKHLSIMATITKPSSKVLIKNIIGHYLQPISLFYNYTEKLIQFTSVNINGEWIGLTDKPLQLCNEFRIKRREKQIDIYASIHFNTSQNEIYILTDAGRLTRPLFYIDNTGSWERYLDGQLWSDISGSVIEWVDMNESEGALICPDYSFIGTQHTHMEIDNSLIFGVMGNCIPFPEHNQFPRNVFSCGQSRQAVSLYNTNYLNRIDGMGVVLDCGQTPLVQSKYFKYTTGEKHPYGVNAMVAILSYSSYNVEDAILINAASLDRGLFHTTYYSSYQAHEEINEKTGKATTFSDVKNNPITVTGIKSGWDYNQLDSNGIIREGTKLTEKMVVIGKTKPVNATMLKDDSVATEKGQLGYVDKVFLSYDEEGKRIAKVRVREERIPSFGDKFASRFGQKGTIGRIIKEEDMPFNADGVRPDLIINPHAIPSRMTIGQLIDCVLGKACSILGGFGNSTSFEGNGKHLDSLGKILIENGYERSGEEILYNGMNGEQLEANVFFGPTYYMRLKHMVKDKINFRARGPKAELTRQPVGGRALDGGLKIGQMERDCIISHGISKFTQESFMDRSDAYSVVVSKKTGLIAKYNPEKNIYDDDELLADNTFCKVNIPYSFKLMIQELETMNVSCKMVLS